MIKTILSLLLLCSLSLSCAHININRQEETTTRNIYPRPLLEKNIKLSANDILLDARPAFDYMSSHLSQAYYEDYRKYQHRNSLWPKEDLSREARSLARKGLTKDSRVIVLGNGKEGNGEECRLAWNLYYMGIDNVHFVKESSLDGKRVTEPPTISSEPSKYWYPEVRSNLVVNTRELMEMANSNLKILDARSEKDFLKPSKVELGVDFDLRHVNWREFLDENGRSNLSVVRDLQKSGIKKDNQILVIDQEGLGGACVFMALLDAGFENIYFFAGGYASLLKEMEH